ncbi:hypothetical protein ACFWAA_24775 [Streptomyces sp. NPDC059922]|uniref:hypothetical protein n=1 Tax=Streptomyces sp. NPDC059922 TaxID=3347005 RepID=UPI0036508000
MPRLYSTMTGDPFSSSPIEPIRPPTWRLGGEQSDQLVPPSADGGLGHVVAIGHVGQALVVRCTARTITPILPGGRRPHRDTIAFRWRRSRSASWLTVRVDSDRRH